MAWDAFAMTKFSKACRERVIGWSHDLFDGKEVTYADRVRFNEIAPRN